ncbi:MAG: hypothetical protein HQK83_15265 [Fibrobacteria bacterium]|nr:hypothetical protein [Fibrobacteria bacterium]
MSQKQCPGMNPSFWKPKDVDEHKCPSCGNTVEFWKDDVKRVCHKCKKVIFNPKLGNLCLSYCDKAEDCIGSLDINEWKQQMADKMPKG